MSDGNVHAGAGNESGALDATLRWHLRHGVRALAAAFARAEVAGIVEPTGYVAVPDQFNGLAFARALVGQRAILSRDDAGEAVVGCAPFDQVVRALGCVDPAAARSLLGEPEDEGSYPVVVVWRSWRIVRIGKRQLTAASYAPSTRAW